MWSFLYFLRFVDVTRDNFNWIPFGVFDFFHVHCEILSVQRQVSDQFFILVIDDDYDLQSCTLPGKGAQQEQHRVI